MNIASLARMWLTRSTKPFQFTNENDEIISYKDEKNLGLYVHIPFCKQICEFCPYCKELYAPEKMDDYVLALIKEIRLIGSMNAGKKRATSLYFGGGSPALAAPYLKMIINEIEEFFEVTEGIGIELHPGEIDVELLTQLKEAKITKISVGIQSFQKKYTDILHRGNIDKDNISSALNKVPFETVSMDFIFALPDQTYNDLQNDIDTAFSIGANHIAIYPFIDFAFSSNEFKPVCEKDKKKLLYKTLTYCREQGYNRTSIWTFSNEESSRYSSMTRENFLGFGCSATTLLKDSFKINTFSADEYIDMVNAGRIPTSLTIKFTKRQRMIYYLFWETYTTTISPANFESFFGSALKKKYGLELAAAKLLGFIHQKKDQLHLTERGTYYYHYFEQFYTLSYIDKMWGIMKEKAFPEELTL